jgi:hypothetical protein
MQLFLQKQKQVKKSPSRLKHCAGDAVKLGIRSFAPRYGRALVYLERVLSVCASLLWCLSLLRVFKSIAQIRDIVIVYSILNHRTTLTAEKGIIKFSILTHPHNNIDK